MKKQFLLLMMVAALLWGCSDQREKLRVKSDNTKENFGLYQNLEFIFARDVVSDDRINQIDTLNYLIFDPPIFGRFMWTQKNVLSFSPSMGFAPAASYKGRWNQEAFTSLNKDLIAPDKVIQFNVNPLDLQAVNCFWTIQEEKKGLQFLLNFNYSVLPEHIENLVTVKLGKTNYKAVINPELEMGQIAIFVEYAANESPDQAEIIISKGAGCLNCGSVTAKDIAAVVDIPDLNNFSVVSYEAIADYEQTIIKIFLSQPVDDKYINKYVSLNPSIESMTIEPMSGGLLISGDFDIDTNYEVVFSADMKSKFGILLGEEYRFYATFSKQTPYLVFEDASANYLSLKGKRNIVLNASNVKNIQLSVFKVYENNISDYLYDGKRWDWDYYDDYWYDYNYWPMNNRFGDIVFTKTIETNTLPVQKGRYLLKLDPDEMQFDDKHKGMYVIKVEDKDHAWAQASMTISMSDIGLIARQGPNSFMVTAVSIQHGTPLNGVKITLISSNNQEVATQTTNADGVTVFENTIAKFKQFTIGMVTARKDNDFNYLRLYGTEVNSSKYDLSGKYSGRLDFDLFVYGDRELYRPGDSVHINAIVREWNYNVVNDIPINIRVRNPMGEQFGLYRKTLNKSGSAALSFELPSYAATGSWNVTFENAAGVVQKNYIIQVEEFMPDRIKVTTNSDKSVYMLNDAIKFQGEAFNLFGPPSVGRSYEITVKLSRKSFYAKQFPDYNFSLSGSNFDYCNVLREGTSDENGAFSETFFPELYSSSGVYSGTIFTTVFDETGRPVNRMNRFEQFTQDVFIGIKYHDYWYGTSIPLHFNVIAVDAKGELSQIEGARVQIIRKYWETVQVRVSESNQFEYRSQERQEVVYDKSVNISGKESVISYTPRLSGYYEMKVYLPESDYNYTYTNFYAYGYETTSGSSFAVDKEGSIKIETDKDEYEPNEKAQILFTAPFSGKMLVTVERESVQDYYWLNLENKTASLSLNLKNEYIPNCYISATAFRDLSQNNAVPLTVARGYENITVRRKADNIAIKIDAEEKSRSQTQQTIKIKAEPNSYVTIAAVDEGILQITNYQTPNPYAYFYGKRALEMTAYDIFPFLFREAFFDKSTVGGDNALELDRMVNPMQNNRVKLITFWSGAIQTDKAGKAEYTIDIPQFSGSLRIMAVSWKEGRFGSASQNITVSDPIVISSGIPRFFSPRDLPKIPVVLTNTTAKEANVKVSMSTSPLLTIQGEKETSVTIKPNGEATCYFDITASNDIGTAEIEVKAHAFSETFTEKTDISIRPATGFTSIYHGGVIKRDEPLSITIGENFVNSTVVSEMMLSRNLAAQYAGDLAQVVYYPYGCLEQTTSRAFPLLYLDDLATSLEKGKMGGYSVRFVVNESIKRINSMKNSSGGLNYWPGGSYHNWWSECYAAHFLTEARKAGYTIDDDLMQRVMIHLSGHAKTQYKEDYWYWNSQTKTYQSHKRVSKSVIYALYVLALNGKQEIAQMNYYKNNAIDLTPDMRVVLGSAFAIIGDMPSCEYLMNYAEDLGAAQTYSGGDFSSNIRNSALMLNYMIDAIPNDPRIPALTLQLNNAVKNSHYLSTQERAFTLLAFGKLARRAAGSTITADVALNGKNIGHFDGKDYSWQGAKGETGKLEVKGQGSGDLYYFVETSGIPTKPLKEEDNNVRARKRFLDRNGKEIDLNDVKQGALIYIEIAVNTTNSLHVDNVAVQDLLPACFEIENSRLNENQYFSWMKSSSSYDYQDIRDDRITFFSSLSSNVKYYYYVVRAVSTGTYVMGALSATAMYDGNYSSIYGQGKVTVK